MKIRITGTSEQHEQFNSLLEELEKNDKLQIISTSCEYKNRNSVESSVYIEIKFPERNKIEDYEDLKIDYDNDCCFYYERNKEVKYIDKNSPEKIRAFREWFKKEEEKYSKTSFYYKNTALYFTYNNVKYYISWTFYGDNLILDTKRKLKELGAINIIVKYGELD